MGRKQPNPPAEAPAEIRLRSMTGFARTVAQEDGFTLRLSLRSVVIAPSRSSEAMRT